MDMTRRSQLRGAAALRSQCTGRTHARGRTRGRTMARHQEERRGAGGWVLQGARKRRGERAQGRSRAEFVARTWGTATRYDTCFIPRARRPTSRGAGPTMIVAEAEPLRHFASNNQRGRKESRLERLTGRPNHQLGPLYQRLGPGASVGVLGTRVPITTYRSFQSAHLQ